MTDPSSKHSRNGGFRYLVFALIPAIVLFAGAEIVLRVFNFKFSNTPIEMRAIEMTRTGVVDRVIKYNNADGAIRFIKDKHQLWVPADSFEDDYPVKKAPGTIRIATLGDSCTQGCHGTDETYPGWMEKILNENSDKKFEVLNAGVGSYSSFQGVQRFRHAVLKYHPDIVTVYFGWNDHWVTARADKEVKFKNNFILGFVNFAENFRVYQALNYFLTKARYKKNKLEMTFRVAPDDYARNLNSIIDIAEENDIQVFLITAPKHIEKFSPTAFFPFTEDKLLPLHEQYTEIVRRVAAGRRVPLIDLEKEVDANKEAIFSQDGIHFNPYGCRWVAEAILAALKTSNVV